MKKYKQIVTFGDSVDFKASFVGFSEPLYDKLLKGKAGDYDLFVDPFQDKQLTVETEVFYKKPKHIENDVILREIDFF